MARNSFQKDHPNYYDGKKVGKKEFTEIYNAAMRCELSLTKASVKLGVSRPTFRKWCRMVWQNGLKLDGLYFIRENGSNESKKGE
jgi:hypothetical protein